MRLVTTIVAALAASLALLTQSSQGGQQPVPASATDDPAAGVAWETAFALDLAYRKPEQTPDGVQSLGARGAHAVPYWHGGHNAGLILTILEGERIGAFLGVTVRTGEQNLVMDGTRVVFVDDMDREHVVEADSCAAGATSMLFVAPPRYKPHRYKTMRIEIDGNAGWVKGR